MSATVQIRISTPAAGEDTPVSVVWYDSDDGTDFVQIGEELIANLVYDEETGIYTWTLSDADTSHYQLIKTKSAGGIESFSGAFLPPLPSNPALQSLYGSAKEFGAATWSVGDTVEMTMFREQIGNGVILEPVTRTATVDANGQFVLTPDKGVEVTVQVKNVTTGKVYFSKSFVVDTEDQKNIKDY
jgi:hypothetical protein